MVIKEEMVLHQVQRLVHGQVVEVEVLDQLEEMLYQLQQQQEVMVDLVYLLI